MTSYMAKVWIDVSDDMCAGTKFAVRNLEVQSVPATVQPYPDSAACGVTSHVSEPAKDAKSGSSRQQGSHYLCGLLRRLGAGTGCIIWRRRKSRLSSALRS